MPILTWKVGLMLRLMQVTSEKTLKKSMYLFLFINLSALIHSFQRHLTEPPFTYACSSHVPRLHWAPTIRHPFDLQSHAEHDECLMERSLPVDYLCATCLQSIVFFQSLMSTEQLLLLTFLLCIPSIVLNQQIPRSQTLYRFAIAFIGDLFSSSSSSSFQLPWHRCWHQNFCECNHWNVWA